MSETKYIYAFEWSRTGKEDDWHRDSYSFDSIEKAKAEVERFERMRLDEIEKKGWSDYAKYKRIIRKMITEWEVMYEDA